MVELNEDCLDEIFGYLTPVEWIQISEVCRMWKMAVRKQWKKTTAITIRKYNDWHYEERNAVDIPARDARKIVLHAAQFCSSLKEKYTDKKKLILAVGRFSYRVENCTFEQCLELMAKNATELTEVQFRKSPEPELLQLLFRTNQIQTMACTSNNDFLQDLSSLDTVENLEICMRDSDSNIKSFEGLLPNLKTLDLRIFYSKPHVVEEMLSRIFPYVRGIKSLKLYIGQNKNQYLAVEEVVKCFNLEQLSLSVERDYPKYLKFDKSLDKLCPKLRVVTLDKFAMTDNAMHSLLSLSNLEKLKLEGSMVHFCIEKPLPGVINLSKCYLYFENHLHVNMTDLCDAVKKMPKLERLKVEGLHDEKALRLTYEAIMTATSQGKVVVVERDDNDYCYCTVTIEIQPENNVQSVSEMKKHEILTLNLTQYSKRYFDYIKVFVQRNLPSHIVIDEDEDFYEDSEDESDV